MKPWLIAAAGLCVLASPAFALEEPHPGRADPRICTAPYEPNNVVDLKAKVGDTLTLEFSKDEQIEQVAVSDLSDMMRAKAGNMLWFQPKATMTQQPISIRTTLPDGSSRLYIVQWQTAPQACYLVRFTYAAQEAAARRAASLKRQKEREARAAEAALAAPPPPAARNYHYAIRGDWRLIPGVQAQEARH